jgi:hypothetical protein
LIEEIVSADPERQRVVDALLAPVIRRVRFQAPDERFALGEIADGAKGLTDAQLAAAAEHLKRRRESVKPADFADAIKVATRASAGEAKSEQPRPGPILVYYSTNRREFEAWRSHYSRTGQTREIAVMEKTGATRVPTMMPPAPQEETAA